MTENAAGRKVKTTITVLYVWKFYLYEGGGGGGEGVDRSEPIVAQQLVLKGTPFFRLLR